MGLTLMMEVLYMVSYLFSPRFILLLSVKMCLIFAIACEEYVFFLKSAHFTGFAVNLGIEVKIISHAYRLWDYSITENSGFCHKNIGSKYQKIVYYTL